MKTSTMVVAFIGFGAVLWVLWKALLWALFGGGMINEKGNDNGQDD